MSNLVKVGPRVPIVGVSRALIGECHKAKVNGKLVKFPYDRVRKIARLVGSLGGDSRDLARKLNIKHSKLMRWMDNDDGIEIAIQSGIDRVASQIEATMVKMAKGYKVKTKKVTKERDALGKVLKTYTTYETEIVKPDGAMVKMFLNNRMKSRYPKSGGVDGAKVIINFDKDDADI